MNTLDDLTLIQNFVQGTQSLLANHNLRIESASDTVQLLSKSAGLIASSREERGDRAIMVREKAAYWQLLHQVLLENGFMPARQIGRLFTRYERHPAPPGYDMQCTESRVLWQNWRALKQWRGAGSGREFMIFSQNTWTPVLDIAYSHGAVFVRTRGEEVVLQVTDLVLWLRQSITSEDADKTVIFAHRSDGASASPPAEPTAAEEAVAPSTASTKTKVSPKRAAAGLQQRIPFAWRSVVKMEGNRVVIKTVKGDVVIEGDNLQVSLGNLADG